MILEIPTLAEGLKIYFLSIFDFSEISFSVFEISFVLEEI